MPFSAASRIVSRREHATHSGGCGFCTGLGTTLRGGIDTNLPSTPVNGVSVMQRMRDLEALEPRVALVDRVDAEARRARPPTTTRPSRTRPGRPTRGRAWRPARRCGPGGCSAGAVWMMPWPRRMSLVRWLHGGEEHLGRAASASTPRGSGARPPTRTSKPSRSASSTWSSASWISWSSLSSSHGRGSWCS